MQALVSIIIPVYKTEAYLVRCLDSACGQSYRTLEIICVNDGSPDGCATILNTYAMNDKRIKIVMQDNQGLAAARNAGLRIATGDYVLFVDSDDVIHLQMIELMLGIAEKNHAFVVMNRRMTGLKANVPERCQFDLKRTEFTCIDYPLNDLLRTSHSSSACNKLYRRDVIGDLRFIPGIYFEDWPFTTTLFATIDTYMQVDYPLYFYEEGNSSITRSIFTKKKAQDYLTGIQYVYDFFQDPRYVAQWPIARKLRMRTTLKMLVSKISHAKGNQKELIAILLPELKRLHQLGAFRYRELTLKTLFRLGLFSCLRMRCEKSHLKHLSRQTKILTMMLSKGGGGLENVAIQFATCFNALGFHSSVICHQSMQYEFTEGVKVSTVKSTYQYALRTYWHIIRVIVRDSPDIVWCHGNRAIHFVTWVRLFLRLWGTNPILIATAHNVRNRAFHHLDYATAVSKPIYENLVHDWRLDASRVFLCPNAVVVPMQKVCNKLTERVPVIGFLGRLAPVKGGDVLLEAVKLLKQRNVVFELHIGGEGPQLTWMTDFVAKAELTDTIRFLGWVHDKASFFNSIDLFVLPSRSEALPISLLEALSYRTAVVVSDLPGPRGVVEERGGGLIVPSEDVIALANALQRLIEDPLLREELARAGRETIEKDYTQEILQDRLHGIIEKVLIARKGTRK